MKLPKLADELKTDLTNQIAKIESLILSILKKVVLLSMNLGMYMKGFEHTKRNENNVKLN